jgi:acyl-CoA synthetase (AMP-forming)/AMP-acid ligase II
VDCTIPAAVLAAAREFSDGVALAEPGGPVLTFHDLHTGVRGVARALMADGIGPSDRVAIWSPNTHHWVLAGLGALYAGATLVPVNTRFTGPEALDVIIRSHARALLVAGPFLGADRYALLVDAAAGAGIRLPGLVVQIPVEPGERPTRTGAGLGWSEFLSRSGEVSAAAADARAAAVTPDDVSDILFTSGTTGRSKGAMSAHRQALGVATAWAQCAALTAGDRYLIVNPLFHSFGYKAGILACLLTGATMVPQLVFEPGEALRLIEEMRITVFPGAPTIYSSILDHPDRDRRDLSSLRLAVTGAAVVPVALVERMRAELSFDSVLTAYGLTEAVVVTMCRPGDDPQTVATTSGRATAGFEIKIASGTCEILLRGRNVMLGYLDDPAATAEAIDAEGWLHTGDVGRLDERGYLTITDRLKDMYICGGFNVYPAEVEQALTMHPGVAEAAVIGVPDGRLGEVGKAFVVLRPGAPPTTSELIDFCRVRLANYKIPRQIEFRADLPRNPAGKPLKRLLRQEQA